MINQEKNIIKQEFSNIREIEYFILNYYYIIILFSIYLTLISDY